MGSAGVCGASAFPHGSLRGRRQGVNSRDSGGGAVVRAKLRKEKRHDYPWPGPNEIDPSAERGQIGYLSHFKPLKEKPKPVTLPFEKPLMDLRTKIAEVITLFFSVSNSELDNRKVLFYTPRMSDFSAHACYSGPDGVHLTRFSSIRV